MRVADKYFVYDYLQRKALQINVDEFARQLQDRGAGEILINSVDRDGSKSGFDLGLINSVCLRLLSRSYVVAVQVIRGTFGCIGKYAGQRGSRC